MLQGWGIWDEGLTERKARERFVRFEGLDLGVAPRAEWNRLRADLLEFEDHIACY